MRRIATISTTLFSAKGPTHLEIYLEICPKSNRTISLAANLVVCGPFSRVVESLIKFGNSNKPMRAKSHSDGAAKPTTFNVNIGADASNTIPGDIRGAENPAFRFKFGRSERKSQVDWAERILHFMVNLPICLF